MRRQDKWCWSGIGHVLTSNLFTHNQPLWTLFLAISHAHSFPVLLDPSLFFPACSSSSTHLIVSLAQSQDALPPHPVTMPTPCRQYPPPFQRWSQEPLPLPDLGGSHTRTTGPISLAAELWVAGSGSSPPRINSGGSSTCHRPSAPLCSRRRTFSLTPWQPEEVGYVSRGRGREGESLTTSPRWQIWDPNPNQGSHLYSWAGRTKWKNCLLTGMPSSLALLSVSFCNQFPVLKSKAINKWTSRKKPQVIRLRGWNPSWSLRAPSRKLNMVIYMIVM